MPTWMRAKLHETWKPIQVSKTRMLGNVTPQNGYIIWFMPYINALNVTLIWSDDFFEDVTDGDGWICPMNNDDGLS